MTRLVYHSPIGSAPYSPFDSAILDIARTSNLSIVSPYVDATYLTRIVARADEWRLLSDVEEWLSSLSPMARPTAWQFVRKNVERIHHCAALHAKVVIGVRSAIIGSANLTRSGVLRRHEMAVVVEDQAILDELRAWFEALWRETEQPSIDETDAFVRWLDEVAAKEPAARQRFVISSPARRIRARLVAEAHEQHTSPPLEPAAFNLTAAARSVVAELQEHYESVDAVIRTIVDRCGRLSLTLGDVVREVHRAFPRARVREIYLLLIQQCANHPRSVFVHTTENRLVLRYGRFYLASREDVLTAAVPYDAFLCYLIQMLAFGVARSLQSESAIEAATGFDGATQVVLVEELTAAGLLLMEDVPGELPRYRLQPEFDWDGRFLLFARSASVWLARKASSTNGPGLVVSESDVEAEDDDGDGAPSALDRAWSTLRANVLPARAKPISRPPSLDEALSRLLKALFNGTSFKAPTSDQLNALVSSALQIPATMVGSIVAPSGVVPGVVRRVDEGINGCRVEIDPGLTWDALAAYPRTQEVCERFLEMR